MDHFAAARAPHPADSEALSGVLPAWLEELDAGLPVRMHAVLSGNVRDIYPVPDGERTAFLPMAEALWRVLSGRGVAGLLEHDPVEGLRLHAARDEDLAVSLDAAGLHLGPETSAGALADIASRLSEPGMPPVALVVTYGSRLLAGMAPDEATRLFVTLDRLARRVPAPALRVIWLVERGADLPGWFTIGNEAVRQIEVMLPDVEERHARALALAAGLPDAARLPAAERSAALERFALETDGMTLRSLDAVATLARAEGIGLGRISDAIRNWRTGVRRNPWASGLMRSRVANAEAILSERVKGQETAVRKTTDILVRSIMGLSGAQSSSRRNRPRGVLFFAGPTGVGKTELAKAVTELLFGDETAYHRFDMSEFAAENSAARLIGAPPGYPGHEQGGELIRAVRARPFGVFLFDEVEKAHPRILDTFLQIIDEGRLTDSRGETVYFSEALIIFTSNIGIFGSDRAMNRSMNVLPSDPHPELERKIVESIRDHFRITLQRPELMNRIGRNIVVFDFIHVRNATQIFGAILKRVLDAVMAEHGVAVTVEDAALAELEELCTADLFEGGRGIGNRVESHFVNPLARALFELKPKGRLRVVALDRSEEETRLVCA